MSTSSSTKVLFISGKIQTWPGFVSDDGDILSIRLGGHILADLFDKTFPEGSMIYVRLCDDVRPIDRERFLELAVLTMEGTLDTDYFYSPSYSEYTPGEHIEKLVIGQHDLQDWISSREGQYAAILVSNDPITDLSDTLERSFSPEM